MDERRDDRFRQALVVGGLLAPEGAAAYDTAMRWWGWLPAPEAAGGEHAAPGGPPYRVRFITPKRKQAMHPELLGVRFELVFIKPERMFGAELLGEPGLRLRVTDRERTVVDMLDRSDLCGGVPTAAAILVSTWRDLDLERLSDYQERFGGGTVPRRLGYLAERLGLLPPDDPQLARWRGLVGAGYSLLERGGEARGPFVRRWGLRDNVADLPRRYRLLTLLGTGVSPALGRFPICTATRARGSVRRTLTAGLDAGEPAPEES